jgi:hypothetical protein
LCVSCLKVNHLMQSYNWICSSHTKSNDFITQSNLSFVISFIRSCGGEQKCKIIIWIILQFIEQVWKIAMEIFLIFSSIYTHNLMSQNRKVAILHSFLAAKDFILLLLSLICCYITWPELFLMIDHKALRACQILGVTIII